MTIKIHLIEYFIIIMHASGELCNWLQQSLNIHHNSVGKTTRKNEKYLMMLARTRPYFIILMVRKHRSALRVQMCPVNFLPRSCEKYKQHWRGESSDSYCWQSFVFGEIHSLRRKRLLCRAKWAEKIIKGTIFLPLQRARSWDWSQCTSPAWSPSRPSWRAPSCPSRGFLVAFLTFLTFLAVLLSSSQCPGCILRGPVWWPVSATFWQPEAVKTIEIIILSLAILHADCQTNGRNTMEWFELTAAIIDCIIRNKKDYWFW